MMRGGEVRDGYREEGLLGRVGKKNETVYLIKTSF